MPRGPRLDAPGILHHVVVRGIERRPIFRDDRDRDDFVRRLSDLALAQAIRIYAWALLPNHAHLLVRTEGKPLARAMRSLLTGYAGTFNRRHHRAGHLFQNRYKSIVIEEEPYFLELVRYLHLNPLRAGVVADLPALARYPYCGHAALLGHRACPWQNTRAVLGRFSTRLKDARRGYRSFVVAGVPQGRRPDLQGGGLVRSAGGWTGVQALRRGREHFATDERVLGSPAFVEALRQDVEVQRGRDQRGRSMEVLIERVCESVGVSPEALEGGSRLPDVCRVREGIAYLWVECWGRSGRHLAAVLGVRPQSIYRAAQRGRREGARWERVLRK